VKGFEMFFSKRTQEFAAPVVSSVPVVHTAELEWERARNLVEVSRLMDDAPMLGKLALDQAEELSSQNHFDLDAIKAEVSYDQIQASVAS
jgi:hypothetical protein